MDKQKVYFGGIPTEVDVKRIRESFPESKLMPGFSISYEEMENLLGEEKVSTRFKTVTTRWRALLERECGIFVGCEPGVGFKVLDEVQKANLAFSKLRSGVKLGRRSYTITGYVDRAKLDEESRARLDLCQAKSAAVIAAAQIKRSLPAPSMV